LRSLAVATAIYIGTALTSAEIADAQKRSGLVRISPVVGLSLPFGGPFINESWLHKQQVTSAILGGRIDVAMVPFLGLELGVGAGRGLVAVRDSSNQVRDIPATIYLSSAKAVLWVNPHIRDGIVMHVASGMGLIGRSGKAWRDTKPSSGAVPAWIVALGGDARLSRRGPMEFRFELEDYITSAQFNVGLPTQTRALLHHDIVWSLGVSFPIMGRWR